MEYDSLKMGKKGLKLGESTGWIPENFKRRTKKKYSRYKSPFDEYFAPASLVTILTKLLYI